MLVWMGLLTVVQLLVVGVVVAGGEFPSSPDNGPLYLYASFGNPQHPIPAPSFLRSYDKRSPQLEEKPEEEKQEEEEVVMRPPASPPGPVEVPLMTAPLGIPATCICYPSVSQLPRDFVEKMGRNLLPSKGFTEDTQTANLVKRRDRNYLSEALSEEIRRNKQPLKFEGEMEMSPEKWERELSQEDIAAEKKRMIMQPEQDNSWVEETAGMRKYNAISPNGPVGNIVPSPQQQQQQHRQRDVTSMGPVIGDSDYDSEYDDVDNSDHDGGPADGANYDNGVLHHDHNLNSRSSKTYDYPTQSTHNLNTVNAHQSYRGADEDDVGEERMVVFPHRRLPLGLLRERYLLASPPN